MEPRRSTVHAHCQLRHRTALNHAAHGFTITSSAIPPARFCWHHRISRPLIPPHLLLGSAPVPPLLDQEFSYSETTFQGFQSVGRKMLQVRRRGTLGGTLARRRHNRGLCSFSSAALVPN